MYNLLIEISIDIPMQILYTGGIEGNNTNLYLTNVGGKNVTNPISDHFLSKMAERSNK